MRLVNKIKKFIKRLNISKNDPYYHCELFRDRGCAHVDGLLCDFPKCDMNKSYKENKNKIIK